MARGVVQCDGIQDLSWDVTLRYPDRFDDITTGSL
jgi:hypothetical protein